MLAIDMYQRLAQTFGKNSQEVRSFMALVKDYSSPFEKLEQNYKDSMAKLGK